MAKNKQRMIDGAKKRSATARASESDMIDEADLGPAPDGFEEVAGERVVGWFIPTAGNAIRGIMRDVFETKSKFKRDASDSGKRRVYKIEVTDAKPSARGPTLYIPTDPDGDAETAAKVGDLIGLDERGWLKPLARVAMGQEVWVACFGKQPPSSQYPQGAWIYKVLAKPAKVDEVTGEVVGS